MSNKLITANRSLAVLALGAALAAGSPAGGVASASASTGGAPATTGGSVAAGAAETTTAGNAHTTSVATWFGPGFYGKQTACGQTLTPSVVGVAHRTLRCGTLVEITYKGRSLTVPVLDRGPYSHTAEWDLTAGAAQALGVDETVRIATHVVGVAPNTPVLGLSGGVPLPPSQSPLAGGAVAE